MSAPPPGTSVPLAPDGPGADGGGGTGVGRALGVGGSLQPRKLAPETTPPALPTRIRPDDCSPCRPVSYILSHLMITFPLN